MALPLSAATTLARPAPGVRFTPPPVVRRWLPGGDLGMWVTLRAMRDAARRVTTHPMIRQAVQDATGGTRIPRDVWAGLRAWLGTHTRFQFDPPTIETLYTPLDQFVRIARDGVAAGDCDDVATLGAALALAAGQRARFVVVGFGAPGPAARFAHVYTEVAGPGAETWRDFDLTRSVRSPRATRRWTMEA